MAKMKFTGGSLLVTPELAGRLTAADIVLAKPKGGDPRFLKGGELVAGLAQQPLDRTLSFVELATVGRQVRHAKWGVMRPQAVQ